MCEICVYIEEVTVHHVSRKFGYRVLSTIVPPPPRHSAILGLGNNGL